MKARIIKALSPTSKLGKLIRDGLVGLATFAVLGIIEYQVQIGEAVADATAGAVPPSLLVLAMAAVLGLTRAAREWLARQGQR